MRQIALLSITMCSRRIESAKMSFHHGAAFALFVRASALFEALGTMIPSIPSGWT